MRVTEAGDVVSFLMRFPVDRTREHDHNSAFHTQDLPMPVGTVLDFKVTQSRRSPSASLAQTQNLRDSTHTKHRRISQRCENRAVHWIDLEYKICSWMLSKWWCADLAILMAAAVPTAIQVQ